MELLTAELRFQLPPRGSQSEEADPVVHAHLHIPDSPFHWWVTEGSPEGADYVFFGFRMASEAEEDWGWRTFRLSTLERLRSPAGAMVVRDIEFVPGPFTSVVPYPYLDV